MELGKYVLGAGGSGFWTPPDQLLPEYFAHTVRGSKLLFEVGDGCTMATPHQTPFESWATLTLVILYGDPVPFILDFAHVLAAVERLVFMLDAEPELVAAGLTASFQSILLISAGEKLGSARDVLAAFAEDEPNVMAPTAFQTPALFSQATKTRPIVELSNGSRSPKAVSPWA
jgi:hypothetical protein